MHQTNENFKISNPFSHQKATSIISTFLRTTYSEPILNHAKLLTTALNHGLSRQSKLATKFSATRKENMRQSNFNPIFTANKLPLFVLYYINFNI